MDIDLKKYIRDIPNFPKPGIVFRDITTLLKNPDALNKTVELLYEEYKNKGIQKVVGIESRGFIMGAILAHKLGAGLVIIRKPGKLPADTLRAEYKLEYGTDAIEIHKDAISAGERILLHDDLLATGGTINAAAQLVETLGGNIVGISFLIELTFLKGRELLKKFNVSSLIKYASE